MHQKKIRKAEKKEAEEKCTEIERLQARNDNVHKKVREVMHTFKKQMQMNLIDTDGKLFIYI